MRLFYFDEAPVDTLLQIAGRPVWDGDLVSKQARDKFVQLEWVARCHGWNIITTAGQKAIEALALRRVNLEGMSSHDAAALLRREQLEQKPAGPPRPSAPPDHRPIG